MIYFAQIFKNKNTLKCLESGSSGVELTVMQETQVRCGFESWVGKIPLESKMATESHFCWGNPMDRRMWRVTELWSHERVGQYFAAEHTHSKTWLYRLSRELLPSKLRLAIFVIPQGQQGIHLMWPEHTGALG